MVRHDGRHRAPTYSPLDEIADIAARSAQPALKVSAVAVASGGLVATFALPAAAAVADENRATDTAAAAGPAVSSSAPAVAVAAPAVKEAMAPTFGIVGFTATPAAPSSPAPLMITRLTPPAPTTTAPATRASRSAQTPRPAPPAAPALTPAPAPQAATPAVTGGIIAVAASLSGIPYVWGGTTTRGFDCSGYTGYVYRQVGKSIPRTAEAQRLAATKVSNPAPGDLVFFGYPAYHVGIYAGPGKMYASSRPGELSGLKAIWTQKDVSYGRF